MDHQETDLSRLLQAAGRRAQPSPEVTQQIRGRVEAEWRCVVAKRSRRRRNFTLAAAACVSAVIAGWLWLLRPASIPAAVEVARVEGISGRPSYAPSTKQTMQPGAPWAVAQVLHREQRLHNGERVATGAGEGAVLRWHDGLSLHLDQNTEVSLAATDRLILDEGAVYVDSGAAENANARGAANPLVVQTRYGDVRHLGTQYETRVTATDLRISVRTGRVEIMPAGSQATLEKASSSSGILVKSGERFTLAADGRVKSERVGAQDASWNWTGAVAPPFVIDRRPLTEFLGWVSHELGREIVFADIASEKRARAVIMRGSIDGLTPEQALAAVLSTTRLHSIARNEKIVIEANR